jgi:hypothetical protein
VGQVTAMLAAAAERLQVDGQMDKQTDGKMNKRTDGQKKKRQFEKCKNGMSSRFSIFISNNFNFNYFSFLNFLELIVEYLTS